jgi:hypothetical protein
MMLRVGWFIVFSLYLLHVTLSCLASDAAAVLLDCGPAFRQWDAAVQHNCGVG